MISKKSFYSVKDYDVHDNVDDDDDDDDDNQFDLLTSAVDRQNLFTLLEHQKDEGDWHQEHKKQQ